MVSAETLALSHRFSDWLAFHYISTLAVACLLLAMAIAIAGRRNAAPVKLASTPPQPRAILPPTARVALISLMAVALGGYAWLMIAWEDFTFYDAHIFFQSLAGGPQYALLQLFPSLGRAYPLTHQEFYPLSFIGNSAAVYQVFSFLELLLGGFLLSRLL